MSETQDNECPLGFLAEHWYGMSYFYYTLEFKS